MTEDIATTPVLPSDFARKARRFAALLGYSLAFAWSIAFGLAALVGCYVTWSAFEAALPDRFAYAETALLSLLLWLVGLLATYLFKRLEMRFRKLPAAP